MIINIKWAKILHLLPMLFNLTWKKSRGEAIYFINQLKLTKIDLDWKEVLSNISKALITDSLVNQPRNYHGMSKDMRKWQWNHRVISYESSRVIQMRLQRLFKIPTELWA